MQPGARNKVALKSKEQAQKYLQLGNVGRAFAHFLVALKLVPEWKNELKTDFSSSLCAWGEQLETQQRFQDLFNCYEQAVEIFPENEEVFSNLGAHLFRLGHLREAAHYFRQALTINNNFLPAYRNLQNVCNALVERWHFRMLNDSHRNEAYREAILKKVRQGFTSVLDIGTGTGILSLFAVTSGAQDVHACDYSPTMCSITEQVLEANKMADSVNLIRKLSNNLTIPGDLPHRKSLVVTETMDSGLLGEHLLQTLLHAWHQLLRPACPDLITALDTEVSLTHHGVVLPFGARLWAVPIRCPSIARRNFIIHTEQHPWNFKNIQLFNDTSEPYDTDNLRNIKDCKFLRDPVLVFTFDFNDPAQLKAYYKGKKDGKQVSFKYEGKSDALAVWFDVRLDEDITISSSPFSDKQQCCWDQAIFRFKKPQESVTVKANCHLGKLGFEVVPENPLCLSGSDENLTNLQTSLSSTRITSELAVSTEMISFINNKDLQDVLFTEPEYFGEVSNVLDLSPFPLLGLRCVQLKGASLVCVLKTEQEVSAIKEFVQQYNLDSARVKCLLEPELEDLLSNESGQFDYIVNNVFQLSGELRETSINSIPRLMKMLSSTGVHVPDNLTLSCQLIDCDWINTISRVTNDELSQTYRIAEFINVYQVSQQLDVDLRNIKFTELSEVTDCLQLASSTLASDVCCLEEVTVPVVRDGCITAVPLWYQYQLSSGRWLSTFSDGGHINQVVFVVNPPRHVKSGESVVVNVTYHCGIVRLKITS